MDGGPRNSGKIRRRDFLKAASVAAGILVQSAGATSLAESAVSPFTASPFANRLQITAFDYEGVKLRDSRWKTQVQMARNYYLSVSNDDILCGFRAQAGLPAPGKPLVLLCYKIGHISGK
jgi:hypothetical protein